MWTLCTWAEISGTSWRKRGSNCICRNLRVELSEWLLVSVSVMALLSNTYFWEYLGTPVINSHKADSATVGSASLPYYFGPLVSADKKSTGAPVMALLPCTSPATPSNSPCRPLPIESFLSTACIVTYMGESYFLLAQPVKMV